VPDATKEPVAAAPVKRTKREVPYHVLREVEGHWRQQTKTAISASSKNAAISKVVEGLEEKEGRFVAVLEREFQPVLLKIETEVKHVFE
jgi:hypothetical protein